MLNDIQESISMMLVNGNRLELPPSIIFTNYKAVKKTLINAGGKYKSNGFEFKGEARTIKDALLAGEVLNDKKKYQFFETPLELAYQLVDHACIESHHRILEPSAGQGRLLNCMLQKSNNYLCIELMPDNVEILRKKGYRPIMEDFLKCTPTDTNLFDRIVANPPFTKGQDMYHIAHMYSFLKPGGKLVSISSNSWKHGNQKKHKEFCTSLKACNATVIDLPAGVFKESGTQVAANIIIINKNK